MRSKTNTAIRLHAQRYTVRFDAMVCPYIDTLIMRGWMYNGFPWCKPRLQTRTLHPDTQNPNDL